MADKYEFYEGESIEDVTDYANRRTQHFKVANVFPDHEMIQNLGSGLQTVSSYISLFWRGFPLRRNKGTTHNLLLKVL